MTEAIFNSEDIRPVDAEMIDQLVSLARSSPRNRFRLCLHRDPTDAIQEMVICVAGSTYFKPHKHPGDRTESYHLIRGRMDVVFFEDDGTPIKRIELAEPGGGHPFMYRLSAPIYHFVVPVSPLVVYHETLAGPWDPDVVVQPAPFAPDEDDADGIAEFSKRVSAMTTENGAGNG